MSTPTPAEKLVATWAVEHYRSKHPEHKDKTDEELKAAALGNPDTIEAYLADAVSWLALTDAVSLGEIMLTKGFEKTKVLGRFNTVIGLYAAKKVGWMDGGLTAGNKELIRYVAWGVVYDPFVLPFDSALLPGLRVVPKV